MNLLLQDGINTLFDFDATTVTAFVLFAIGFAVFLRALVGQLEPVPQGTAKPGRPIFGRLLTSLFAGQILTSESARASLTRDLRRAGYLSPHALPNYQASQNVAALSAIIVAGGLIVLAGPSHFEVGVAAGIVAILLVVAVGTIPRLVVRNQGDHRIARIEAGLPDALEMVNLSVGGGLTVAQSLRETTDRIDGVHPELAEELRVLLQQAELGTLSLAFHQFGERTDSSEVRAWSDVVHDVEELGADITIANRDHADAIRQSLRHRADARASSAGVKLVMPFLFCIMPAVAILLWGPAYLQVREFISSQSGEGGAFSENLSDTVQNMQREFDNTGSQRGVSNRRPNRP